MMYPSLTDKVMISKESKQVLDPPPQPPPLTYCYTCAKSNLNTSRYTGIIILRIVGPDVKHTFLSKTQIF